MYVIKLTKQAHQLFKRARGLKTDSDFIMELLGAKIVISDHLTPPKPIIMENDSNTSQNSVEPDIKIDTSNAIITVNLDDISKRKDIGDSEEKVPKKRGPKPKKTHNAD